MERKEGGGGKVRTEARGREERRGERRKRCLVVYAQP